MRLQIIKLHGIPMNYEKIRFKCGIEVHNRLATKHKLFCNCPARLSKEKPSRIVIRRLRPVAGELGQVDIAAAYEYLRNRVFYYQVFEDTVDLVCLDDEPPHDLNQEALEVALQVAKLLNCEILDEIHVMRKTVIDGSNTSGFQRTALVGINGYIETSLGKVGVSSVALEEESAGIVGQDGNKVTYRLDRLGIPLVEVGTEPDIKSPEHALEVAEKIGMIIRSTGKSQRGIGVTRQDVNVSVMGGPRVEIKGVQEIDMMQKIINNEVARQLDLAKKGKMTEETRVAKQDGTTEYTRPLPGGQRMYPETDIKPIVITKQLRKIKSPETWESKLKAFERRIPRQLAGQVLKSEYLQLFEKLYDKYDPVLMANVFTSTLKNLKRSGVDIQNISDKHLEEVFSSVKQGKLPKEAVESVLESFSKNPSLSLDQAVKSSGLTILSEKELRLIIRDTISKNPDLAKENKLSPLMGEVMKEVRGKFPGEKVAKVLKEELNK